MTNQTSSRVPRGFFEPQMKKYFSQFGRVNRLRLSRNKKTGASKHYAFVEFASTEVADIVARTMDNYLLFGHILKCKLVPEDQVHPDLFKGAGQRFKVDPKNKKAGLEMTRGVERAQWEKRVANENQRRSGRNKQLNEEFGYEFKAPALKAVADVPKQATGLENSEPQQLLAEAPVDEAPAAEQPKAKKGKKAAKAQEEIAPTEVAPVQSAPEKTSKKDKKRKSDVAAVEEAVAPAESTPKSKKAKKSAKPEPIVEEAPAAPVEEKKPKTAAAKPKKAKKSKA